MITPKVIAGTYAGQRYTCTFDPNAPPHGAWVWHVVYVRTYPRFGACARVSGAMAAATRFIRKMNAQTIAEEEAGE